MNQLKKLIKSPFLLEENFCTYEQCEDIILSLNHTIPDRNIKNIPICTIKSNALAEIRLMPLLDDFLDKAEDYYGFKTLDISPFMFEWYADGYQTLPPHADNSILFNGKWVKSKDIDFTIIIFLSTSKDNAINDSLTESFGGKLEFMNHGLTISSKSGTIVMFPANDHFLNTFSTVGYGNCNCIRVHIKATIPYVYNPKDFPGDYISWFK